MGDYQEKEINKTGSNFSRYFWLTIFIMVFVNIVVIIFVSLSGDDERQNGAEISYLNQEMSIDSEYEIESTVVRQIIAALPETGENIKTNERLIDGGVDTLYAPVYLAVDSYVDDHFTVWGSYRELSAAAMRNLEEKIEERLFGGFDERLLTLQERISTEFNAELERNVNANIEQNLPESSSRDILMSVSTTVIQDTVDRMVYSAPVSGALSTTGALGTKVVAQQLTAKLGAAVAVKTGAKLATKAGASVLGGAATGAAAGAVFGPVGSAVGGVGAAVAVWLGVDKLFVEGDEYFNRESFQAELVAMIDESKREAKEQLLGTIDVKVEKTTEYFTLRELGRQ